MTTDIEGAPALEGTVVGQAEQFDDYWNFSKSERFMFPDGKQWIDFQVMNEGQKSDYQRATNRDITINRKSGNATLRNDIADERHALIKTSVTGWNLRKDGNWIGFDKRTLESWLQFANPSLIEDLEVEIRKANPWLQGEMTVEDIDKEIDRLRELREETVKREEGKGS